MYVKLFSDQNYEFFGLVPKSSTHTVRFCVKTLEPNISSMGPFNGHIPSAVRFLYVKDDICQHLHSVYSGTMVSWITRLWMIPPRLWPRKVYKNVPIIMIQSKWLSMIVIIFNYKKGSLITNKISINQNSENTEFFCFESDQKRVFFSVISHGRETAKIWCDSKRNETKLTQISEVETPFALPYKA